MDKLNQVQDSCFQKAAMKMDVEVASIPSR